MLRAVRGRKSEDRETDRRGHSARFVAAEDALQGPGPPEVPLPVTALLQLLHAGVVEPRA